MFAASTCLLFEGLDKGYPIASTEGGGAALPCHLHCLAAPCHSLAGSWHFLIAGPPPLFVGPVVGTLSGAPPTVPAWLGGSPSDQPPSPQSSTVVHTCPPGGSVITSGSYTLSAASLAAQRHPTTAHTVQELFETPFHIDTANRFSAFTWATYPVLNPVIMTLTRFQNWFENLVRNCILNQFVGTQPYFRCEQHGGTWKVLDGGEEAPD